MSSRFPSSEGIPAAYSARRWESGNLYWARLADEMGYSPVMLNRLVPELTRHMIAKIFATDMEDWPALLRAMQETGEEFRQGKIVLLPPRKHISSVAAERCGRERMRNRRIMVKRVILFFWLLWSPLLHRRCRCGGPE